MAAAYAFLVSLLNTMDQIQIHPRLSTCFDYYQFETLHQMVDFFLDFLVNYSDAVIHEKVDFLEDYVGSFPDADIKEVEYLVRQIAVAARKAEDVIEVEAAVRILAASTQQTRPTFLPALEHIMQEMDSFNHKIIKVKQETGSINSISSSSSSCSAPLAAAKTTMVGFDVHLEKLLDKLTVPGYHSGRLILPIIGMGGIGKTTLARNVYQNLLIVEHFYVRAWITISQEFTAREILLQTLSCLELGGSISKTDTTTDDELGVELYKALSGRRYLIVLDDVWSVSVEAWEKIRFFFPENNNRSRIVVTTRETNVAAYFGSSAFALDFLDDKYSWDLFCDKTFPQEGCPSELEEIGKKIVKKCKGLPLAIILIGGLLRKSPSTREYWEKIRNDKSLILDSEESNKPLSILYMSYKHLPICLKSCFLYLRVFPEDYKIYVPKLVKLWVAEGIIKPKRGHSLEEVAERYIMELVDRNLVLVDDLEINKKLKTCYIHDLVRDLCVRIAAREYSLFLQRDIDGTRLFIVDERTARLFPRQYSDVSERPSIFCPLTFHLKRKVWFDSQLLRVLVCDTVGSEYSLRQVNLRRLSFTE